ncbi:uncharacterized protein LOC120517364 [Polypterus senegalus]|uniref:uncharacterized protein LOC120517364 n=1 Tax=Polypterus senegalus TaxID=55291 RepID=UPI001962938D|nr:uncharacterized protein LOC120517364 [Polypterus senegalus]
MAALQNPEVLDEVHKKINECEKELDQFVLEYNNTMQERKQIYKENVQVVTEQVFKKCTECNLILERQQMNKTDFELMDVEREKKLAELSKLRSKISERENLKRELIKQIEHLREKHMEKKKEDTPSVAEMPLRTPEAPPDVPCLPQHFLVWRKPGSRLTQAPGHCLAVATVPTGLGLYPSLPNITTRADASGLREAWFSSVLWVSRPGQVSP